MKNQIHEYQIVYILKRIIGKPGKFSLGSITELYGSSNVNVRKITCNGQRAIGMLNSILSSKNIIDKKTMSFKQLIRV